MPRVHGGTASFAVFNLERCGESRETRDSPHPTHYRKLTDETLNDLCNETRIRHSSQYSRRLHLAVELALLFQYHDPRFKITSFYDINCCSTARTTMNAILRHALKSDLTPITDLLRPWIDDNPTVLETLDNFVSRDSRDVHCEVVEAGENIDFVNLWVQEEANQVRILAFGINPQLSDKTVAAEFLGQQIMRWVEMGITKACICLPESIAPEVSQCLRSSGFMFEGLNSDCRTHSKPALRFCKHFLYQAIHHSEILDFLRQILPGVGYELRDEAEGFSYRVRAECRPPFSFGFWHRMTRLDRDIIVHPPARVLEWHELETLFYPFQIYARRERPLLLHLEKKNAASLITPRMTDDHQDSLFAGVSPAHSRPFRTDNTISTDPAGLHGIRKGLPMLFYVNRIGAVGHARVDDWSLEDVNLSVPPSGKEGLEGDFSTLTHTSESEIDGQARHGDGSATRSGKALAIRFRWYRPLRRAVKLDEIRAMDDDFNPQHSRSISPKLFRSILSLGNTE